MKRLAVIQTFDYGLWLKKSFFTHLLLSEHNFDHFSYYLLYIEFNLLEGSDVTPDRQHVDVSLSKILNPKLLLWSTVSGQYTRKVPLKSLSSNDIIGQSISKYDSELNLYYK